METISNEIKRSILCLILIFFSLFNLINRDKPVLETITWKTFWWYCRYGACKSYGFIVRMCKGITNIALKALLLSMVSSKVCCSHAWYPSSVQHQRILENVQRKYLKYLSFKLDNLYPTARNFSRWPSC